MCRLTDWLPDKYPVYAWDPLLDQLDLPAILATSGPNGQPPYDPRIMVKILVYGYARGLQSSRQLERACWEGGAFRVLSRNQQPDFWTLATFRRRHLTALGNRLQQSVQLAAAGGWVRLKDVAIDGTKGKVSDLTLFVQGSLTVHVAEAWGPGRAPGENPGG